MRSITVYLPENPTASQHEYEAALVHTISHLNMVGDHWSANIVGGLCSFLRPHHVNFIQIQKADPS